VALSIAGRRSLLSLMCPIQITVDATAVKDNLHMYVPQGGHFCCSLRAPDLPA
jgi:hypothetical protein